MTETRDRIDRLCHTINRVANELPWFGTGPQEFFWAIEAALKQSGLPESWIKAAATPEMSREFQKSFQAIGCCARPDDLLQIIRQLKEDDYGEIPPI